MGKMDQLMRLIGKAWKETKTAANETIFFLIQALLSIIRRNSRAEVHHGQQQHSEKITDILHYLHQNIYSTAHTQSEHLAGVFNLSKNYFGIFFKEQTGVTLRDYVNQYKLHSIENRLQFSSFSLKEISNELGFTDLSHFNKFFKSGKGLSPSAFRKAIAGKN